jgi:hypothetical protein
MVEVHKSVSGPQSLPDIFPRNQFAWMLQQHGENLEGLVRKAHVCAVAPKLP